MMSTGGILLHTGLRLEDLTDEWHSHLRRFGIVCLDENGSFDRASAQLVRIQRNGNLEPVSLRPALHFKTQEWNVRGELHLEIRTPLLVNHQGLACPFQKLRAALDITHSQGAHVNLVRESEHTAVQKGVGLD